MSHGDQNKRRRRVHTRTNFAYGLLTINIVEAKNLKPSGKRCDSFIRLSVAALTITTDVVKKNVSPSYNFTAERIEVDRDDVIDIRVIDKYEADKYEFPGEIDPLAKAKIKISSLQVDQTNDQWIPLTGTKGGELHVITSFTLVSLNPAMVFTKMFYYPTYTSENARLTFVKPMEYEDYTVGINTLIRAFLKWLRNQRGIAGLDPRLLDIELTGGDACLSLISTYQLQPSAPAPQPPASTDQAPSDTATTSTDDDDDFINVLQYKVFNSQIEKTKEKKKISSNGRDAVEYRHAFRNAAQGLFALKDESSAFIRENIPDINRLFRVTSHQTDLSQHVVVWYYR